MTDPDTTSLLQRYLDGTISPDEMASLNRILENDANARLEFADWLNLQAGIEEIAASAALDPVELESIPVIDRERRERASSGPLRFGAPRLAAAAIAAILVASALWSVFLQDPAPPFATVVRAAGTPGLARETPLRTERRVLSEGFVEVETSRGARIVIEAPAVFQFENAQLLHLYKGRLAADVPPSAKGFTVVTPSGEAVDLGTRFGVDVAESGSSEIHVFDGEVVARAHPEGASPTSRKSLRGGEALSLHDPEGAARKLRTAAFLQSDEIPSLSAALSAGQQARAEEALNELRDDPSLVALLDFENDPLPEGKYRMVQGRWPGSRAPEFLDPGDHMTIETTSDALPRVSLAAWVRLDHLGDPYQSLLHADGWNEGDPGKLHWMIVRNTTMRLALFGNRLASGSPDPQGFPDSATPVLPEQGRWVHLAAVYDSEAATVRFFLNGRFDEESRLEISHPARIGPARIGNWNLRDRKLSGRVDEFVILGRALGDDEIAALFAAGNPYGSPSS